MSNWFGNILISEDDQDPSFVKLLRNILIVIFIILVLLALIPTGVLTGTPKIRTLVVTASLAVINGIFIFLVGKKILWPGKLFLPSAVLIALTYLASTENGLHDVSVIGFPGALFAASLFMGRKSLPIWTAATVLCIGLVGYSDMAGYTPEPVARTTHLDTIAFGVTILLASAGIINVLLKRFEEIIAASRKNEAEQIQLNKELKELQADLEKRVEDRTIELEKRNDELNSTNLQASHRAGQFEALAQVSQSILSIRDLQELLPLVASAVSEKYGFYHVGVFLLDATNEYAVLTATNSKGGQKMLERKHRLKVGEQGIVGSVTATGEPRIALDVGTDAVFFNNPDLPDTHSEMALPLRSKNRIVGALDVQSTEIGAFTAEDAQTLSLLANQVSLAIENARLFDESNSTLDELQTISRQSTREAWKRLPQQQKMLGYRYDAMGASPLKELVKLADTGKSKTKAKGAEAGSFVVPIELRGEVIGNLVVQSPSGNEWNSDQQDLIRAVAERVALSAENARLFEETTQRAERERLVSEITGKIRSHNDPQTMIETAVNELRNALGASRVEVIPQTKTSGTDKKD